MVTLIAERRFDRLMAPLATVALALLLMAAAGMAAVRLGLPPALGYLAAGLAAGLFFPEVLSLHEIENLAELGVLALLFFIGLELDLKRLRRALKATAWSIPFDIAIPGLAVAAVVRLAGWSFTQALAMGMAMSISSTLFGERLTSLPGVDRKTRERVLGVLVSEDVAAAGLIALIIVLGGDGGGWLGPLAAIGKLLFFLVLLAAGALFVIPRILDEVARRHVPEVLALWAAGLVVLSGYLGYLAGSPELGALLAGVAAAEAGSRYVVRNTLAGLRDLAAAVFFLSSGLAVDALGIIEVWPIVLAVSVLFALGKTLVHLPAGIAGGLNLTGGMRSAVALSTIGEFSLILAAVAENNGVAHPAMRAVAVGTMVVLLPTSSLLTRGIPAAERKFWRLPGTIRRPAVWLGQGLRGRQTRKGGQHEWQAHARLLAVNVLLMAAWFLLAAWLAPRVTPTFSGLPFSALAIWAGIAAGLSLPMVRGAFLAYRRLVWGLVGLREGEREGAGKVRERLVDALVTIGFVLVLLLASLRFPQTTPFLAAGAAVAIIVAAVAWRQLSRFHQALEATLGRVLGHDPANAQLLDSLMDRYPWGVKFAAVIVPPGSPVANRSLRECRISALSGATVAVLQRGRKETVNPPPDSVIRPGDTLVMLGDLHQLARAEALVVAHGEAIRMTAQTSSAVVEEQEIDKESPWVGKKLGDLRIREDTGTLVVGLWSGEQSHPVPYRHELPLQPGDRLILLGTPLQLQRARIMTQGIPEATPTD